jgi:hypothetical protein
LIFDTKIAKADEQLTGVRAQRTLRDLALAYGADDGLLGSIPEAQPIEALIERSHFNTTRDGRAGELVQR